VYSVALGRLGAVGRDIDRLPVRVTLERLGRGLAVLDCAEVPRYVDMMQYAFKRIGWNGERFDVYRCRLEYPVMQSLVDIRFELPEKPG
jgi:hypothetical protein